MLALLLTVSIILNGLADGIRFKDLKSPNKFNGGLYHVLYALVILCLVSLLSLNINIDFVEFLTIVLGYAVLRFGIFDFVLNITARKPMLYIGNTSFIDRFLNKLFPTADSLMLLYLLKGMSIIGGLYLIQHYTEVFV